MRQRLGLAQALLNDPKLLILDEPTVGLDPVGTELMKNTLKEMSGKGVAVMFSSHELQAIEDICNRVIVIQNGELIFNDNIEKINNKEIWIKTDAEIGEALQTYGENVDCKNGCIIVKDLSLLDAVIGTIKENNFKIIDLSINKNMLFKFFEGGTSK